MFAQVYECPKCGDVWRGVSVVEAIDTERDEVYPVAFCDCGSKVSPKMHEGVPVWHALTDSEIEDEMRDWSLADDDEEFDSLL